MTQDTKENIIVYSASFILVVIILFFGITSINNQNARTQKKFQEQCQKFGASYDYVQYRDGPTCINDSGDRKYLK